MKKFGVFICHCGTNIAGTVDVKALAYDMGEMEEIGVSIAYPYLCSSQGQQLICGAIRERGLAGVVVAACSPGMHEHTFRNAVCDGGLNPHMCEIANIREQCSWVHKKEKGAATGKAAEIIRASLRKLRDNKPLQTIEVPVGGKALVIGGGVAGITAALHLADGGCEVVLLERESSLGGRMSQISRTYPDLMPAAEVIAAWAEAVGRHRGIEIICHAELTRLDGSLGNFDALIAGKAAARLCPEEADDPVQDEEIISRKVAAVVVATGYDLYPSKSLGEYGGGAIADVIDSLSLEAMLAPGGPTQGKILRPSDGTPPEEIVFIQCVGSRDPERHMPYCSRVCCLTTVKQAKLYKEQIPGGQPYIFYMDTVADGKGQEEFLQKTLEEERLIYLRGRVSRVYREGKKVMVEGVDTLTGRLVEVAADMVVLAKAMIPRRGARELAAVLRTAVDRHGFFTEAHPKLQPVESATRGIYLAGCCHAPKDIPDTIAQAVAVAGKIQTLISAGRILKDPVIAFVDQSLCSGCGICVSDCPYQSRELDQALGVAIVRESLCQGCGACVAACPGKACALHNNSPGQVLRAMDCLAGGD